MMDSTSSTLPTGACNFRDLAQAGTALTCGCQRFWRRKRKRGKGIAGGRAGEGRIGQSPNTGFTNGKETTRIGRFGEKQQGSGGSFADNDSDPENSDDDCRCGHHACFHSFERRSIRLPHASPSNSQSTGRHYSLQVSDAEASLRLGRSGSNLSTSGFSITSGATTERDYSTAEPSRSSSTARPSRQNHIYQSFQQGAGLPTPISNSQATTPGKGDELGDLLQGFQSVLESLVSRTEKEALGNSAGIAEVNLKLTKLIELNEKLEKSSKTHAERLETVETFGAVLEEVRDKLELTEDRANEVDEKIFSFENRLDDRLGIIESYLKKNSKKRKLRERELKEDESLRDSKRRKGGQGNESEVFPERTSHLDIRPGGTASVSTSASSSPCTATSADREAYRVNSSLLTCLESRLIQVEKNAPPSPESPWVIEVVLLPPSPLRGIWNDGTELTSGYESSNPQSVSTYSGAYPRRQSNDFSNGPVPRSFGVNSRLYRRLGTRGFVRHINVLGPTSQDVAAAVDFSFGGLITWCHSFYPPGEDAPPRLPSQHHRVSLDWQPLRKVHKQTNLEFLKPGEMMEIMWTVDFLKGSCIMKGRRTVLYITPLLQPSPVSSRSGPTWKDVKALPDYIAIGEFDKDTTNEPANPENDLEDDDCWAWLETLDNTSEVVPVSPSERSISPVASWSSFGPFQLEEEAQKKIPGSEPNGCHSPGPPSPPVSFPNRKYSPPPPPTCGESGDRVQNEVAAGIEGLTPVTTTTTTRSSMLQSSSVDSSGGSSSMRESWKSSLSVLSNWHAVPRTFGWVNDDIILEDVGEEEHSPDDTGESGGGGDGTVEDTQEKMNADDDNDTVEVQMKWI